MVSSSKKAGRPSHEPTGPARQMVEVLVGFGVPIEEVSRVVGVAPATLYKHYKAEIDAGRSKVQAKLIGQLMRIAKGSDRTALDAVKFILQTRFGWSQYAPARPADEPLGKKAAADLAAQTAHEGTSWGDLVH